MEHESISHNYRMFPLVIRVISVILVISFLAYDISWAYPDSFKNLAVTGLQNEDTQSRMRAALLVKSLERWIASKTSLDKLQLDDIVSWQESSGAESEGMRFEPITRSGRLIEARLYLDAEDLIIRYLDLNYNDITSIPNNYSDITKEILGLPTLPAKSNIKRQILKKTKAAPPQESPIDYTKIDWSRKSKASIEEKKEAIKWAVSELKRETGKEFVPRQLIVKRLNITPSMLSTFFSRTIRTSPIDYDIIPGRLSINVIKRVTERMRKNMPHKILIQSEVEKLIEIHRSVLMNWAHRASPEGMAPGIFLAREFGIFTAYEDKETNGIRMEWAKRYLEESNAPITEKTLKEAMRITERGEYLEIPMPDRVDIQNFWQEYQSSNNGLLPSLIEFGKRFGVSKPTAAKWLKVLKNEGLEIKTRGEKDTSAIRKSVDNLYKVYEREGPDGAHRMIGNVTKLLKGLINHEAVTHLYNIYKSEGDGGISNFVEEVLEMVGDCLSMLNKPDDVVTFLEIVETLEGRCNYFVQWISKKDKKSFDKLSRERIIDAIKSSREDIYGILAQLENQKFYRDDDLLKEEDGTEEEAPPEDFDEERPGSPKTAIKVIARYKELQRESGFTLAEYIECVKRYFDEQGKKVKLHRTTYWRDLRELEKRGILRKVRSPDDKRKNIYYANLPRNSAMPLMIYHFIAGNIVRTHPTVKLLPDAPKSKYKIRDDEFPPQEIRPDNPEYPAHQKRAEKYNLAIETIEKWGFHDRAERLRTTTTPRGLRLETHLIFSDRKHKHYLAAHIGRERNTIYIPLKLLDEIEVEELAALLNDRQAWLDKYNELVERKAAEHEMHKELAFYLTVGDERVLNRLKERLEKLSDLDEEIIHFKIIPGIEKEREEIEQSDRELEEKWRPYEEKWSALSKEFKGMHLAGTKIPYAEYSGFRTDHLELSRKFGLLTIRYNSIGEREKAREFSRKRVQKLKEVQFYEEGAAVTTLQERIIYIDLREGMLDEFLPELKALLSGKGFPRELFEEEEAWRIAFLALHYDNLRRNVLYLLSLYKSIVSDAEFPAVEDVYQKAIKLFEDFEARGKKGKDFAGIGKGPLPPYSKLAIDQARTINLPQYILAQIIGSLERGDKHTIENLPIKGMDWPRIKDAFLALVDRLQKVPKNEREKIFELLKGRQNSRDEVDILSIEIAKTNPLEKDKRGLARDSARYYENVNKRASVVLDERFFDTMHNEKHKLAASNILAERFAHELCHTNRNYVVKDTAGRIDKVASGLMEAHEEVKIANVVDKALYEPLGNEKGTTKAIAKFREQKGVSEAMHNSGTYFKLLKNPIGTIIRHIQGNLQPSPEGKGFPIGPAQPDYMYRERLLREEPIDNDLFITIFDYKEKLYVKLSERIEIEEKIGRYKRRLKREPNRTSYLEARIGELKERQLNLIDEMRALTEEAKVEIDNIVKRGAAISRKKESNLPLVRVPQFVSEIRDSFTDVLSLVEEGRDHQALKLVKDMLDEITNQQSELVARRLGRPRRAKRITLPGWPIVEKKEGAAKAERKRTGVRLLQRYYPKGSHKYRHPEYDEATFALFWQLYEATDKGIDYEVTEETATIPKIRSRLAGIISDVEKAEKRLKAKEIQSLLPGFEDLRRPATLRKKTIDRFSRRLELCLEELERSPVKTKVLAMIEIRTALELFGLNLPEKAKKELKSADSFLKVRQAEAKAIRESLVATRLKDLRDITERRNEELGLLANDIIKAIESKTKWIINRPFITLRRGEWITISDAAVAIGKSYWMREPEFVSVRKAAFGIKGSYKRLTEENKQKIIGYAKYIADKSEDAKRLAEFMKDYRARYIELRLEKIGHYEAKLRAFNDMYEEFAIKANITRGSPEYYKYFAAFFIPVFISTRGKKKPSLENPITSPLFKASQDLLRIIETVDFKYLINPRSGLKEEIRDTLSSFKVNIFSKLKLPERRSLISTLTEAYDLTEADKKALKEMARLIKIKPKNTAVNIRYEETKTSHVGTEPTGMEPRLLETISLRHKGAFPLFTQSFHFPRIANKKIQEAFYTFVEIYRTDYFANIDSIEIWSNLNGSSLAHRENNIMRLDERVLDCPALLIDQIEHETLESWVELIEPNTGVREAVVMYFNVLRFLRPANDLSAKRMQRLFPTEDAVRNYQDSILQVLNPETKNGIDPEGRIYALYKNAREKLSLKSKMDIDELITEIISTIRNSKHLKDERMALNEFRSSEKFAVARVRRKIEKLIRILYDMDIIRQICHSSKLANWQEVLLLNDIIDKRGEEDARDRIARIVSNLLPLDEGGRVDLLDAIVGLVKKAKRGQDEGDNQLRYTAEEVKTRHITYDAKIRHKETKNLLVDGEYLSVKRDGVTTHWKGGKVLGESSAYQELFNRIFKDIQEAYDIDLGGAIVSLGTSIKPDIQATRFFNVPIVTNRRMLEIAERYIRGSPTLENYVAYLALRQTLLHEANKFITPELDIKTTMHYMNMIKERIDMAEELMNQKSPLYKNHLIEKVSVPNEGAIDGKGYLFTFKEGGRLVLNIKLYREPRLSGIPVLGEKDIIASLSAIDIYNKMQNRDYEEMPFGALKEKFQAQNYDEEDNARSDEAPQNGFYLFSEEAMEQYIREWKGLDKKWEEELLKTILDELKPLDERRKGVKSLFKLYYVTPANLEGILGSNYPEEIIEIQLNNLWSALSKARQELLKRTDMRNSDNIMLQRYITRKMHDADKGRKAILKALQDKKQDLPKEKPKTSEKLFNSFLTSLEALRGLIKIDIPVSSYKTSSPVALILYADSILEQGAALDLKETLRKSNILDNSTIIIYGQKGSSAFILERIIREIKSSIKIMVVQSPELSEKYNTGYNDVKELDSLIRFVRAKGINNGALLGVIKGPTLETDREAVTDISNEYKLPIISFESDSGIYSFSQALAAIINIKNEDGPKQNRWFKILPPLRKITDDIKKAYEDYLMALRELESRA